MPRNTLRCSVLLLAIAGTSVLAADKPRVFVTESTAAQASGDASAGDIKGALAFTGGTSPQSVEVIKEFSRRCPGVVVTNSRDRADYVVRLDHEALNPTTPFVHGNKIAVFDKKEDLVYSNSTHLLGSAVKNACSVLTAKSGASGH